MDPKDISEPMARLFVDNVKHNRNARRLIEKMMVKGGIKCMVKGGAVAATKRAVPIVGLAIAISDELFNVDELY
jgi:hypothetical protein